MVMAMSCKSDDNNGGKLDPNAKVYINSQMPKSTANQEALSPLEVIKRADKIHNSIIEVGLSDFNRDLENLRIVGTSTWVVSQFGELTTDFIKSSNNILVTIDPESLETVDTIAYIPNSVMRTAEATITTAYNASDFTTCYKLFEEAFVFIPTTGKEYRELQAQGKN